MTVASAGDAQLSVGELELVHESGLHRVESKRNELWSKLLRL